MDFADYSADDISLASVDANPTFDQANDGGSSSEFSTVINSVGQWGTEIANIVNNGSSSPQRSYAESPYPVGSRDYYGGNSPRPGAAPPMKQATKVLLVVLAAAGVYYAIHSMGSQG